ncbi:Ribosomal RNA small subunit methyltransferase D [compost metagenome]
MKVVAGTHRGRNLKTLAGEATRPSSGLVRGAIFNIVGPRIHGMRVLDLYSGSGALGIEALSRGAESALLVESAAPALAVIKENLSTLKLEAKVMPASVLSALKRLDGPFDLILADPPYAIAAQELPQVMEIVLERGLLAEGGLIILEHRRGETLPESVGNLVLKRSYPYSDTEVSVYELPFA